MIVEDGIDKTKEYYHAIFSSGIGAKVLGDIAELCHVFDPINPNDHDRVAERNVALVIMQTAGAFDSLYPQLGLGPKHKQNEPT